MTAPLCFTEAVRPAAGRAVMSECQSSPAKAAAGPIPAGVDQNIPTPTNTNTEAREKLPSGPRSVEASRRRASGEFHSKER